MAYLKQNNNVIIVVWAKFTKWNHDISADFSVNQFGILYLPSITFQPISSAAKVTWELIEFQHSL